MDILEIFFITILGFSIVSNFLSIPGNFIIFLNTVWYGIATDFNEFSFSFLITLFIVAFTVELLEYFIIAFGARKYGASRLGVVGAILGGIGGGISGFFFSPVFGALVGGFAGVIVGTLTIELLRGKNIREAGNATLGALLGRVGGLTVKAIGSVTMVFIVANKMFM
ncbi:MAG: DUF456 domain-containing protein [Calditrichaeota bacterium]|nr:DUF456 domain-containing protein [Calditrichota bacterium]RQV99852.1 MAG: DUF456 domain-containing protein [Calditrichota bacterium]